MQPETLTLQREFCKKQTAEVVSEWQLDRGVMFYRVLF